MFSYWYIVFILFFPVKYLSRAERPGGLPTEPQHFRSLSSGWLGVMVLFLFRASPPGGVRRSASYLCVVVLLRTASDTGLLRLPSPGSNTPGLAVLSKCFQSIPAHVWIVFNICSPNSSVQSSSKISPSFSPSFWSSFNIDKWLSQQLLLVTLSADYRTAGGLRQNKAGRSLRKFIHLMQQINFRHLVKDGRAAQGSAGSSDISRPASKSSDRPGVWLVGWWDCCCEPCLPQSRHSDQFI